MWPRSPPAIGKRPGTSTPWSKTRPIGWTGVSWKQCMAADGNGRAANGGGAPATNGKAHPIEDHTYHLGGGGAGGAGLRAVVGWREARLRTACLTKRFPT